MASRLPALLATIGWLLVASTTAFADFAQGVALGPGHACATTLAGTVECWGDNTLDGTLGRLGNDTVTFSETPLPVSGLQNAVELVAGVAHTCALVSPGDVYCWGLNSSGQLGDGTTTSRHTPLLVSGLGTVYEIAAGQFHTCAATASNVWCWGDNERGQLGDGTTVDRATPVSISGVSSTVAAGDDHTCAGALGLTKCWGANDHGQVGDGTTTDRLTPTTVVGFSFPFSLVAGGSHTCALTSAPAAPRCWGNNANGQLGDGTTTDRATPTAVVGMTDAYRLAAGDSHTCAVNRGAAVSGAVKCWGANASGQLGDGTLTPSPAPVAVSGLGGDPRVSLNAGGLGAGGDSTCAVVSFAHPGAAIRCWGNNINGQLGDGTTTSRSTPVSTVGFDDRCVAPQKTTLVVKKLDTPPGDDVLSWKGEVQLPFPYDPPLDPVANGVHVVLYEYVPSFPYYRVIIDDVTIPGGAYSKIEKKGWKANTAATTWTYVNAPNDQPSRIYGVKIKMNTRTPGLVQYQIKGKAGSYAFQGPGQTRYVYPLVSLETPSSRAGQCAFEPLYVVPYGYHCFFNNPGSTLTCR